MLSVSLRTPGSYEDKGLLNYNYCKAMKEGTIKAWGKYIWGQWKRWE